MIPRPPIPPPGRIIREGGRADLCEICGSSLKRRWFGFGKVIGCLQPKRWNWHGWSQFPAGSNRPIDLYGAPEKPPYLSQLPSPRHYPPMPKVKPPRAASALISTPVDWDEVAPINITYRSTDGDQVWPPRDGQ